MRSREKFIRKWLANSETRNMMRDDLDKLLIGKDNEKH